MTVGSNPMLWLANNRNLLRAAALTASSVAAVENQVRSLPTARAGTGQAVISGAYSGQEAATFDVEILDNDIDERLISAPIFTGRGSARLTAIEASGTPQTYTLELRKAGVDPAYASIIIEGVTVRARESGPDGNDIAITVDRSGLTFTLSDFSTLAEIAQGGGGADAGLSGPGFDWDTKPLGANGTIPDNAHRVAFGDDRSNIHLAYKQFVDGAWVYHLVPAATRAIPAGTPIYFVTGGREVTLSDGVTTEIYADIVTAYDLLDAWKTTSQLVTLDGVVANDRTPTGQASREVALRTDAHAELSTGSGSKYAQLGFDAVTVDASAVTEIVTATAIAVSSNDHPLASLGHERWALKGSLSGDLGIVTTGQLVTTARFTLRVPVRLPPGFGTPKGRIAFDVSYASRAEGESEPPICAYGLLGPAATDKTIVFEYVERPSGECDCTKIAVPNLGGPCLGNQSEGTDDMAYEEDTRGRLKELYEWWRDTVRENSAYRAGAGTALEEDFLTQPDPAAAINFAADSLKQIVDAMAATLLRVDPLEGGTGTPRAEALAAWDAAFQQLQDDIEAAQAQPLGSFEAIADENLDEGDFVNYYHDGGELHTRKAITSTLATGFAAAAITSGQSGTIKTEGIASGLSALTPGTEYKGLLDGSGDYEAGTGGALSFRALSATELIVDSIIGAAGARGLGAWLLSFPSDRYKSAMIHVVVCAGLDPSGESDASILESGDGCWRDLGHARYWQADGFAPLFSNNRYYLSRLAPSGKYFSTHELSLFFAIKCPEDLKLGDRVTVTISQASWGATYQLGDEITLPVIGAGPHFLAGGAAGDQVQEWYLSGSVDGPLPPYEFDPNAPAAYAGVSGLSFLLVPGGIPNVNGDKFTWTAEGGHFRWRRDGGAWDGSSPPLPISASPTALDDGLSVAFLTGSGRSFVAGDQFRFRALQPWALSNVRVPTLAAWKWDGATATLDIDLGASPSAPIDTIALVHDLPAGATITLDGGVAAADEWTEALPWRARALWKVIDREARYLRLTVTGAEDGVIYWGWLGLAFSTHGAAVTAPRLSYASDRAQSGMLQGGPLLGKTVSADIEWPESAISEDDVADLTEMVDHCKEAGDEPLMVIVQRTRDEAPIFGRINQDEVDLPDAFGYQPNAGKARILSARLQIAGVWR